MKARIWKETAKGRRVPGTLREVDVPIKYYGAGELSAVEFIPAPRKLRAFVPPVKRKGRR